MKKKIPIKEIADNLVLTIEDKVFAYYKVTSDFVMSVDFVRKRELMRKVQSVLEHLSKYGSLDIRLLPRDMTLEERLSHIVEAMPEYSQQTVKGYAQRVLNMVKRDMGRAYVYEWYIGVPLSAVFTKRHALEQVKQDVVKGISRWFGYHVNANWQEEYHALEQEAYLALASLRVSRLSQEEMYYLTRLNFIRNMPHAIEDERVNQSIAQVCEGVLDFSKMGQIHLGNVTGESYIACLPLASTDDVLTENDLSELVTRFDFPVELQYQVFYEDTNAFFGGIKSKAKNAKERLRNIHDEQFEKTGELSKEKVKTGDILDDMLDRLESEKEVFVGWSTTLVVYAKTSKALAQRVKEVMTYMNKQRLYFVRGLTEQYDLFMHGFLGQVKKHKAYWYHISRVEGFCQHLLFTHSRVGTKTGFYLGRVDMNFDRAKDLAHAIASSHQIVLFNPTIINKGLSGSKTDSPHIVVTGETGKGKSFLINYIHFYLSFFTKSIYIDVKNEKKERYLDVIHRPDIQENYPHLVKHIQEHFKFITLDADDTAYHGVLDPLLFLEGAEAKGLAETIFYTLYPFKERDMQQFYLSQYLNEVIKEKSKGKKVGLMNVVQCLMDCEEPTVHACGLTIFEKVKCSVLMLLFGNENSHVLSFDTKNTILGLKRLDLPDMKTLRTDYTPSQEHAMLVMYALGYFSKVFGSNPNEFTATYIDEAWLYFSTTIGKGIMREMKRIGRSYNNALVLGTQSVKDFSEDDKGNFGTFFAFDEPSERADILKHLNLPVTPLNEIYLEHLIKGQCLYLDNYGRCQKMTVHCPFEEVAELFKTVDKTDLSDLEQQFV